MSTKFRVTNITKKPGVKKGPNRMGFFVDVKPKGVVRPMWVGEHVDVDEVTPGMMAMQEKGYISIEEIKDLNVQIKKQIEKVSKKQKDELVVATDKIIADKKKDLDDAKQIAENAKKPLEETTTPTTGLDKQAMKDEVKSSRSKNTAKVDGEDSDPLSGTEESVNPDGEPNFVVKASTGKKGRKGSKKK